MRPSLFYKETQQGRGECSSHLPACIMPFSDNGHDSRGRETLARRCEKRRTLVAEEGAGVQHCIQLGAREGRPHVVEKRGLEGRMRGERMWGEESLPPLFFVEKRSKNSLRVTYPFFVLFTDRPRESPLRERSDESGPQNLPTRTNMPSLYNAVVWLQGLVLCLGDIERLARKLELAVNFGRGHPESCIPITRIIFGQSTGFSCTNISNAL